MYNITTGYEQSKWKTALDGLLNQTLSVFFPDGIAAEVVCEPRGACNVNKKSFKGLLAQNMAATILMAPYTSNTISPLMTSSAEAAAAACHDSNCGVVWNTADTLTVRDTQETNQTGTEGGLGSQLSALSFIQGLLLNKAAPSAKESASDGDNATSSGGSASPSGAGTPSSSPSSSGTGSPSATADAGNAVMTLKGSQTRRRMFAEILVTFVWLLF
jgi:mannan endo-1,6-alpha-mannosidase